MTGIITTFPPVTELPPGSASGPANLPPVTYQYAVLGLAQTWTGLQTFAFGMFQLAGSTSGVTALRPQAVAGGILSLPNGPDTLAGLASTGTFTNKTWNGATITVAFGGTGATALTAHGVLLGEGISAVVATTAMTDGQLLVGQTGADPLPKTATGDVAVSAAGALTIAANAVTYAKLAAAAQGLTFQRLPKTGNYTVANADKGLLIAFSGGFFTLTFTAISGGNYDPGFNVAVINDDATASKIMAIGGGTNYTLWPGQIVIFVNDNGVWKSTGPYRYRPAGAVSFFVDPVNGLNTNDGFAAGAGRAWQTIQFALTTIQTQLDLNGGNPTLNLANGTYTESFTLFGGFFGGFEVSIVGNTGLPSSVVWNGTLACRDGGTLALNGIKFTSSASQCLLVGQMFVVDMQNMEWGACASGVHIQVDPGGYVNFVGGTYVVSAAAVFHIQLTGSGAKLSIPASQTISVPSALTFTTWLYNQSGNINFGSGVTFTGTGAGAGSTGKKWDTNYNGVTLLSGCTTVPGATAGVPAIGVTGATGGQVA